MNPVEAFRSKPAPVFGGLIAWDLPRIENTTLISVRDALVRAGLSPDLLPNRTNRETMALTIDLFEEKHDNSILVRKIRDDAKSIVYGIVNENKDMSNDKLAYNQNTTINMNKELGTLIGEGPHFEEFRTLFRWVRDYALPVDIQKIMREVVRMVKGIAYRHGGGTYFYSSEDHNIELTCAAAEFVKILNLPSSHVSNIPLSGGNIQKAEIFHVAKEEIKKQIDGIRKAAENGTKRASSLSNHEGQLKDVAELMEYYINLTQMEADEESRASEAESLRKMVSETADFIAKKMSEIQILAKTA